MNMDLPTTVTVVGSAILSKDALMKIFGPTCDVLGGEMKNLVQRLNINLDSVFARALRKGTGDSGSVDLRVSKELIEQAKTTEDAVSQEYLAGLLSSSKSNSPFNDRAISYIAILKQMSSIEVRLHYLIYSLLHVNLRGSGRTISMEADRNQIRIAIEFTKLSQIFNIQDQKGFDAILPYAPASLLRHDLIGSLYQYGDPAYLRQWFPGVENASLIVCPSILGCELFLWACGNGLESANRILDGQLKLEEKFPEDMRIDNSKTIQSNFPK
jgi:hypothetical protein